MKKEHLMTAATITVAVLPFIFLIHLIAKLEKY